MASSILDLTIDGSEWSASRPGRFTPRERVPGTSWTGGWVGPRAILDAVVKRKILSPRRESNPDRPARSPALYRLNYQSVESRTTIFIKRPSLPEDVAELLPHGSRSGSLRYTRQDSP
jgi:hypothetical protein